MIVNYGAADDAGGPTVGVTLSPWLIAAVALVWLAPKLLGTVLQHSRKKDER